MIFHILSFKYFEESFGTFFTLQLLMLARSVARFACLLSSFFKLSILCLISGLKFSLLYKFSFLSYFSLKIVIFSWVVEFLENISEFSLKQDLVYSHQLLAEERLLDPRPWQEGSYKVGSVCWSFCPLFRLSISFLEIGFFFFFLTWHDVRGPYIVVCDSRIFLERIFIGQKWSKMV